MIDTYPFNTVTPIQSEPEAKPIDRPRAVFEFPGIAQMKAAGWRRGMKGRKLARKKFLHGKSF